MSNTISRTNKQIHIDIKDNYRIIAISDIHGHLELFQTLIKNIDLLDDDYLIIIGDFINKGPDNLKIIHYMMELEKRPRTIILKGNHEYFICEHIFSNKNMMDFIRFLQKDPFVSVIHDMCSEIGYDLYSCTDGDKLRKLLLDHYKQELNYINTLPIIAYADDNIFVHGGYDDTIDLEEDEYKYLKFDDYNRLSDGHNLRVIVGHWPTANLRKNRNSNAPFFNSKKNIISIDGGMGVKTSGELNALFVEKSKGVENVHYYQENHFELHTIKESHRFDLEERYFINYPDFDIKVIKKGEMMTKCLHLQSGKEISIFNDLLKYTNGKPELIVTYINHFLNLEVGDAVELCMIYGECALVKHGEEFGWILRKQLEG